MSHLFMKLSKKDSPRYVIEGDIKGCFDNIKHDHITETLQNWQVPNWINETIYEILKSKIFHEGQIYDSETGTPQGGVISPLLANVALTTLDNFCQKYRKTNPIVRYADDFIIVSDNHKMAQEIKEEIAEHLQNKVGLTLSKEKTKITHISEGFNFLGFSFKKHKNNKKNERWQYTLLIKPQAEKVKHILANCSEILSNHKASKQSSVIKLLNQQLVGWGMYYRHAVSSKQFNKVDFFLRKKLLHWAKRRHPNKSNRWVITKYFKRTKATKLHFTDKETDDRITILSKIPIKRFIKINNDHRIYNNDPITLIYWEKREYLNAFNQIESIKRSRLFSKQKGVCPHCKGIIKQQDIQEQGIHVHHVIPRSQSGTDNYSNLKLIHTECHREIHSKANNLVK